MMHVFMPEDYVHVDQWRPAGASYCVDPFAEDFVVSFGPSSKCHVSNVEMAAKPAMFASILHPQEFTVQEIPRETLKSLQVTPSSPQSTAPVSETGPQYCDKGMERNLYMSDNDDDTDIQCSPSSAPRGVCTITAQVARKIFLAKMEQTRHRRDGLAARLGDRFGISAKAVRDIWRLRTWAQATRPLWTPEDKTNHLKKRYRIL